MAGSTKRKPIDANRLATALAKAGIHSLAEIGRMNGYNDLWLSKQVKLGSINLPMISALERVGISYDDVKPLTEAKEKPVAKAPSNTIADMDREKFFRELYATMYAAVRDALKGEG